MSHSAAVGGGGDPVPLVLIGAQSLPGLGRHHHAQAEGPAALVQVRQRHPAGHGRVVVGGQQHRAGLACRSVAAWAISSVIAIACASATRRFAGALQDEVPGVGVVQAAGAVERGAEPAQQGRVPELDVAGAGLGGADAPTARPGRPSA